MTEDANDEESLDSPSFEQQREESSVEEVVPESSYIRVEDSLVWSTNTDGLQPPNRRLFAKSSNLIHNRNLVSSLNSGKDLDIPDFRFTRTGRSTENQVEVLGTQDPQLSPFQEKDTLRPRRALTNGARAILSSSSSVDAKEEELISHSPFLTREAPPSSSTLDNMQPTNSMQDISRLSVLTQVLPPKAQTVPSRQAPRHQVSQPHDANKDLSDVGASDGSQSEHDRQKEKEGHNLLPLDTPSTQLLSSLALQGGAMNSPLSEKTTGQRNLAIERGARAAAAEARRQKELEASTTDEDMGDEEDEATDSETEQQMEEELKKVEEKARKVKEEEARKAKEEKARREKEEVTRKAQEARKAKEEEARKEKEERARKAQEEERKAEEIARKAKEEEARKETEGLAQKAQEEEERKTREEKVRKYKEKEKEEEKEARMKEQQEAEKRKAEEAKAAVEAENKKTAGAAEEAVEKKTKAAAEKLRKKQEQEEVKRIEKERKAKEKAEELERRKQEKAKQKDKGKAQKSTKASEYAEENSTISENTTPKAPEPPASQAGKKRQRPAPNESLPAVEDAPQGKKQKITKAKVNNPKADNATFSSDLHPLSTPKVASALRKTSPNGTPAAKARRSVSFADIAASALAPQNSSATEAPTKVYPKTPVPPPVLIPSTEPTSIPATKPAAKSKTPIPLPDLRAITKATTKKAAPKKTKAVETKPVAAKGNKSKLSEELVESESESDNAQQPSKPVQKASPPTQDQAETSMQKKVTGAKAPKEAALRPQEGSDIDMDYVPASEVVPKAGGRITRAVVGAVLHEPLPKPRRGKKIAEAAVPHSPPLTTEHVDVWNLSSSSEEGEEDEQEAGPSRAQDIVSEVHERIIVLPEKNSIAKPNTKSSSASSGTESETETTSPNDSESESDDASPSPKSTPRASSPKAQQIANTLTKALGRTIASSNTTTQTASQQIPPSSQSVTPFLPPSTQKYKSLSQFAVEEDYPEVSERLFSQVAKKREVGSDSDDEDEEESSSESESGSGSESGSDSDSSSGADIIPNTKRAGGAASTDKKKSGGKKSLGGFLNRSKLAVFSRISSWFPEG